MAKKVKSRSKGGEGSEEAGSHTPSAMDAHTTSSGVSSATPGRGKSSKTPKKLKSSSGVGSTVKKSAKKSKKVETVDEVDTGNDVSNTPPSKTPSKTSSKRSKTATNGKSHAETVESAVKPKKGASKTPKAKKGKKESALAAPEPVKASKTPKGSKGSKGSKTPAPKASNTPAPKASKSSKAPKSSKKSKKAAEEEEVFADAPPSEDSGNESEMSVDGGESGGEDSNSDDEDGIGAFVKEGSAWDDSESDANDDDDDDDDDDGASDGSGFGGLRRKGSGGDDGWMGDSSDDDGSDEELPIEREARELDEEQVQMEAEAAEEMVRHIKDYDKYHLPTAEEMEEEAMRPPDLKAVRGRIQDVVHVLDDFKERRVAGRSRPEYMERLKEDVINYYNYHPDMAEYFLEMFKPAEALQFFEANEKPRPVVIRTNTLKTRRRELAQALVARGVNLEPLATWTGVGLQIFDTPVRIGATPEYLAGHYMLQSPSSFVPAMACDPQPGERVLDMCASPGGKSTYLAQLMRNTGVLVANDLKESRIASLKANMARMGVRIGIVSNLDGRKIPEVMGGFDRVLLDAPCSGLGVIARDPSIKSSKTKMDLFKMGQIQRQLLKAAVDSVDAHSKSGGIIVYSTCSVAVEEDEAVIDFILKKRCVKLVPLFSKDKEDIGRPGYTSFGKNRFHPSMKMTRRFFPHVHNMDGFFVAKLKKYANAIPVTTKDVKGTAEEEDADEPEVKAEDTSEAPDLVAPEDGGDDDEDSKAKKPFKRSKVVTYHRLEPEKQKKAKLGSRDRRRLREAAAAAAKGGGGGGSGASAVEGKTESSTSSGDHRQKRSAKDIAPAKKGKSKSSSSKSSTKRSRKA